MEVIIKKLNEELIGDYLNFFDTPPHATGQEEHKCYCVWWCRDDCIGVDFSTVEKRRMMAEKYIQSCSIRGYLAYVDGRTVGWCNANTKSECQRCYCWRRFMSEIPTEETDDKVKSIFCFAVAPDMREKGIASKLLEKVCVDAADEGFIAVEAYPNRSFINEAEDFMGPSSMYEKAGFLKYAETHEKYVVRKALR